jgi:hypothetical protein
MSGAIVGTQLGPEVLRLRVEPDRPGARPIVLTVGPAPKRFQQKPRRQTRWQRDNRDDPVPAPRTLYWVVAGELSEDRDELEYISRHYDFGIATRSALRRANKLIARPRSKK